MTKVLLMSDSHGLTKHIDEIVNRHEVDVKIHCGDSELSHDAQQLKDFVIVRGNCDWDQAFLEDEVIDLNGLRLLITHGHLYGIKSSLMQLRYRALEAEANIVLFGHSHIAYAEQFDKQLFINPGSIQQPRKWNVASYCILSWDKPTDVKVIFYDIAGNEIDSFPYETSYEL